jgi:hypothetical protein
MSEEASGLFTRLAPVLNVSDLELWVRDFEHEGLVFRLRV